MKTSVKDLTDEDLEQIKRILSDIDVCALKLRSLTNAVTEGICASNAKSDRLCYLAWAAEDLASLTGWYAELATEKLGSCGSIGSMEGWFKPMD